MIRAALRERAIAAVQSSLQESGQRATGRAGVPTSTREVPRAGLPATGDEISVPGVFTLGVSRANGVDRLNEDL